MKHLILFIALFQAFLAGAQTQPPIVMGSKLYEFKNGLRIDSALFLPRKDTGTTDLAMLAAGMLVYRPLDSLLYYRKGNTMTALATGGGTVTSVGLALPLIFNVTGSPVTSSGTLIGTLVSQAANTVLAAPNGSAGVPVFRPLVSADISGLQDSLNARYTTIEVDSLVDSRSFSISKQLVFSGDSVVLFGDSYSVGVGASETWRSWANTYKATMNVGLNNEAISGIGAAKVQRLIYTELPTLNNSISILSLIGLNDLWQNNGQFLTVAKIFNVYRSMILNNFLASAVAASDASVVAAGTWVNQRTDSLGGKATSLGAFGRSTTVAGSTLTYAFSGTSLVIGAIGVDGINKTSLDFVVEIDGVGYGIFHPNGQTDGQPEAAGSPNCRSIGMTAFFTNLPVGNHTVTITAQSGIGTGPLVIDYLGTLKAPEDCTPIYAGEIARLSQSGYNHLQTTYGKLLNDSIVDLGNYWIRRCIQDFTAYPVTLVQTSTFFVPETDIKTPADIHPNDLGHTHIAAAFMNAAYKRTATAAPTWQEVTTAGNTTTQSLTVGASSVPNYTLEVVAPHAAGFAVRNTSAIGAVSGAFLRRYQSGIPTAADQRLGGDLYGANTTGTTVRTGAQTEVFSSAAWTDNVSHPAYWRVTTVPAGSTIPAEVMRATSTARVLIGGITDTGEKLQVTGSSIFTGLSNVNAGTGVGTMHQRIGSATGSRWEFVNAGAASDRMQLRSYNSSNVEAYRFDPNGNSFVNSLGGNFGVGVITAAAKLHVLSTTEQLRLGYDASNYMSATVNTTGSATLNLTGTTPTFSFGKSIGVTGTTTSTHFAGNSGTPTFTPNGNTTSILGTGYSVNITGNDAFIKVQIITGTGMTTSGTIGSINFNTAYASTPVAVWSPSDVATLSNNVIGFSATSTTGVLVFSTVNLPPSTTYTYSIHVGQ